MPVALSIAPLLIRSASAVVRARLADAEMVEMRHQQHIFAGQRRIGAGQDGDDVGAGEAGRRRRSRATRAVAAQREAARAARRRAPPRRAPRSSGAARPGTGPRPRGSSSVGAEAQAAASMNGVPSGSIQVVPGRSAKRSSRAQGAAPPSARVRIVIRPTAPRAAAIRRFSAFRWAATSLGVPVGMPSARRRSCRARRGRDNRRSRAPACRARSRRRPAAPRARAAPASGLGRMHDLAAMGEGCGRRRQRRRAGRACSGRTRPAGTSCRRRRPAAGPSASNWVAT